MHAPLHFSRLPPDYSTLAELILVHPTLRVLNINQTAYPCDRDVVNALAANSTLREVSIAFSPFAVTLLYNILDTHPSLERIETYAVPSTWEPTKSPSTWEFETQTSLCRLKTRGAKCFTR